MRTERPQVVEFGRRPRAEILRQQRRPCDLHRLRGAERVTGDHEGERAGPYGTKRYVNPGCKVQPIRSLTRRPSDNDCSIRGAVQAAETRGGVSVAEEDVAGGLVLGRGQGADGPVRGGREELRAAHLAGDSVARRAAADTWDAEKGVARHGRGFRGAE